MRTVASAAILLLLACSLLAGVNARANGTDSTVPYIECRAELPGSYNILYNDTDGDGMSEVFCYGPGFLQAFDPPSYRMVLELDGNDDYPRFRDLGGNGSVQLVVFYTGTHSGCSVISGKDFIELWRSPDINGSLVYKTIKDVDGDGWDDFVWIRHHVISGQNATSVQIWSWENRTLEWESPPYMNETARYDRLTIQNVDTDPAQEIMAEIRDPESDLYDTESLQVYDGLTHQLQWEIVADEAVRYLTYGDFVDDLDNDAKMEVLLEYRKTNSTGQNTSGLLLLSGATGAVLWNVTTAGNFSHPEVGDLDGDGGTEVLISGRDGDYPDPHNATFEIFDLKRRERVWALGPCHANATEYGDIAAKDVDGDGASEILFSNVSSAESVGGYRPHEYQLLDGRNFSVLWSFSGTEGYFWYFDTASFCSTERPMILLTGRTVEDDGPYPRETNGSLRVVSTDDFRELWRSPIYPGGIETRTDDFLNDSRKELLLIYHDPDSNMERAILLDTRTFDALWTSPASDSSFWLGTLWSMDIAGDAGPELFFVNESYGMIYSGNSVHSVTNTTIMMFNGTSLEEIWRSETSNTGAWIWGAWDFDNDSNVEIILNEYSEGYPNWGYFMTVWEFPRAETADPGVCSEPPGIDLRTPKNGDVLWGPVNITGVAMDDWRVKSVEVRIDNGTWTAAGLNLSAGGRFCDWNLTWNASALVNGTHRISARSYDGQRLSPEVSVTVTVKGPEVKRPKQPGTVIGAFPDPLVVFLALVFLSAVAFIILLRRNR